jgi:predicted Zn-dependent protease
MAQNADDPFAVWTQARIDLFAGNLNRARQRTQHAVNMALESNLKEAAANMLLTQATAEALLGESTQARKTVAAVIKLADSKIEKSKAARVMVLNGQGLEARQIMDGLVRENPSDTLLNAVDAPLILAASQLGSGQADQVLRSLESVKPYEFGIHGDLLPNYLCAMAYLQLRKAQEAATEFRAVLDHRGVAPMSTMWEMSHLGLARSYALQGDTAKAKAAYQDFLTLWKDADPDIPILKQAKAEYAKLN